MIDVVINLGCGSAKKVRVNSEKIFQHTEITLMAQPLSNGGGIVDIEKKKNAVFLAGFVVPSPQKVADATGTVFVGDFKDHDREQGQHA